MTTATPATRESALSVPARKRPFLKWAGNKYAILEPLRNTLATLPGERLIEPFAGSGALFLNTAYPQTLVADANPDLITLYQMLQTAGDAFIPVARAFFASEYNTAECYYDMRSRFNQTSDPLEKSALFLYLNRHGYNGLCRYNAKGGFNVPFGRYHKPYFPEAELHHFIEQAGRARFVCADFRKVMAEAGAGDIVYCDPPYVPLSATASFTGYRAGRFGLPEQEALAQAAEDAARRGARVMISNHDMPLTRELYQHAVIQSFHAPRMISCNGARRQPVREVLAVF